MRFSAPTAACRTTYQGDRRVGSIRSVLSPRLTVESEQAGKSPQSHEIVVGLVPLEPSSGILHRSSRTHYMHMISAGRRVRGIIFKHLDSTKHLRLAVRPHTFHN